MLFVAFCQCKRGFQSTLPARGATGTAARGGGFRRISIHAPRTGSDMDALGGVQYSREFQSTLPARGATLESLAHNDDNDISIHAPRTGSDP